MMLDEKDWASALEAAEIDLETLHQRLKEVLHEEGRGSIAKVQEALGVSGGYLRRQRGLKRLELGLLLKILRLIEMPLDVFLRPLGSREGAGARFIQQAKNLPQPPEVQEVQERLRK